MGLCREEEDDDDYKVKNEEVKGRVREKPRFMGKHHLEKRGLWVIFRDTMD